jgi:predicted dehydrogenase
MKIGLIGYGMMGKYHYRALKRIHGVYLEAVCDPNLINEPPIKEKIYHDVDQFLEKETLDAVIICVPTFLHYEVAIKCLKKNLNLLIEKPIASNPKEAEEIIKLAKEKKVKIVIGHVERFNPVISTLRKELEDKEIYSIQITRVGPFPPRIADVGVLTDLSVHDIDLIRYISQKEILETKIFKSRKIHNHHEDNAELSFLLENDIVASITTNWLTPYKKRSVEVATDTAYYSADLMSQELKEYSAYKANNSYIVRDCFVNKGEPLLRELEAFIDYLRTDNMSALASPEDGAAVLKILKH